MLADFYGRYETFILFIGIFILFCNTQIAYICNMAD